MRIGLSLTTLEPSISQGKVDGIGMYTKNLYEGLLRQSIGAVNPYIYPNTKEKITSVFPNGKVFKYSFPFSTIASILSPVALYKNIAKEIDLYHATDHMIPCLKDIPLIATIHDAIMLQKPEWHSARFGRIKKLIRKQTLRWPDRFITISHAMKKDIVEFGGIHPDKIEVIYHGVADEWFLTATEEMKVAVRKRYHLPEQFILFASTLQERKNLPRLVNAYLKLPIHLQNEYPFIIVGRSAWNNSESVEAVQKIISQKKGAWLDYVNYDDLRTIFQCASLYVHPSLHEGFGLTILEAFASQTPVITSNVTSLPEVAGDAALLIDPLSENDIKEAIEALLLDSSLRQQCITRGLGRAKKFTWDECVMKTMSVYQSLL